MAARKDIEALTARLDEEGEKLKEKNEMLMLQFEKTANDIFERKTRQFKDVNKESLDIILKPLKDNISDFKQRVEEIYSKENENRGALKAELNSLMELNRRITEETNNLTSALRGNSKVQGDWGEMILDTILESSNLQKGIHYTTQTNVKDAEGNNLRPDVILNLPDGKRVVIDSKVSLTAYVNYCACEEEESRRRTMAEHLRSVRNHVNELGRKSYQESVLGFARFRHHVHSDGTGLPGCRTVRQRPVGRGLPQKGHHQFTHEPLRHAQDCGRPLETRRPRTQRQPHRPRGGHDVRQIRRIRHYARNNRQEYRHHGRAITTRR